MKRFKDADRLQHILDAISKIESFLMLSDLKKFLASEKDQSAVCMQMTIIGEAAGKLSPDLYAQYPEIPWHQVISMRNVLVHDYIDVNYSKVWDTTQSDLPVLKAKITGILAELQPQNKPEKSLKHPKI